MTPKPSTDPAHMEVQETLAMRLNRRPILLLRDADGAVVASLKVDKPERDACMKCGFVLRQGRRFHYVGTQEGEHVFVEMRS